LFRYFQNENKIDGGLIEKKKKERKKENKKRDPFLIFDLYLFVFFPIISLFFLLFLFLFFVLKYDVTRALALEKGRGRGKQTNEKKRKKGIVQCTFYYIVLFYGFVLIFER